MALRRRVSRLLHCLAQAGLQPTHQTRHASVAFGDIYSFVVPYGAGRDTAWWAAYEHQRGDVTNISLYDIARDGRLCVRGIGGASGRQENRVAHAGNGGAAPARYKKRITLIFPGGRRWRRSPVAAGMARRAAASLQSRHFIQQPGNWTRRACIKHLAGGEPGADAIGGCGGRPRLPGRILHGYRLCEAAARARADATCSTFHSAWRVCGGITACTYFSVTIVSLTVLPLYYYAALPPYRLAAFLKH